MNIAWFGHIASARANGLVSYSHEMIRGIRQRGHHVTFFYHTTRERGLTHDPRDIRLGSLDILNRAIISSPRAKEIIEETFVRERIDIAHVSMSFSQLDFSLPDICHDMNVPVIATLHFPYGPPDTFWGSATRMLYYAYAGSLKHYDAVIVFSEKQRAVLVEDGVARENVRVIPNGIDVATYSPGASDYKSEIGASVLIAYIGRVDPEKNVDKLCETFRNLNLPYDHKTLIVGSGTELGRLRRKFKRDPQIIFKGYVGDLRERIRLFRATDIFVLPSAIEGLSLAMLEAMATGNAVIATDVGADAEALRGAGLVIDLKALEEQLPLALRTLIEYPEFRRDLAHRARQRVVEQYSLETNIDRVVSLYQELTGRNLWN